MRTFTRRRALAAAGGLSALAALAACGATPTPAPPKPTEAAKSAEAPKPTQAAAAAPAAGTVTVEYLNINNEAFGGPAVAELVKLFHEKNPTIRIDAQYVEGVYAGVVQKVQAGIAAKAPPRPPSSATTCSTSPPPSSRTPRSTSCRSTRPSPR